MLNEDLGIENQVVIRHAPSPVIRQRGAFLRCCWKGRFPQKTIKKENKMEKTYTRIRKGHPPVVLGRAQTCGVKKSPLVPAPTQFIARLYPTSQVESRNV